MFTIKDMKLVFIRGEQNKSTYSNFIFIFLQINQRWLRQALREPSASWIRWMVIVGKDVSKVRKTETPQRWKWGKNFQKYSPQLFIYFIKILNRFCERKFWWVDTHNVVYSIFVRIKTKFCPNSHVEFSCYSKISISLK